MRRIAIDYAKYPDLADVLRGHADPDSPAGFARMPKDRWHAIRDGKPIPADDHVPGVRKKVAPAPLTPHDKGRAEMRADVCRLCDRVKRDEQGQPSIRLTVKGFDVYTVSCHDCGCAGLSLLRGACPLGKWKEVDRQMEVQRQAFETARQKRAEREARRAQKAREQAERHAKARVKPKIAPRPAGRKAGGPAITAPPATVFGRIVCINLDRRPDRWTAMQERVQAIGKPFTDLVRVRAVDGSRVKPPAWWKAGGGAWGIYATHLRILEDAIMDGLDSILILEDDALFVEGFAARLNVLMAAVPDDWHHLYLGGQHLKDKKHPPAAINDHVVRCHNVNRCHAHALRGDYLRAAYQHLADFPALAAQHAAARESDKVKAHHLDHSLGLLHESGKWNVYAPAEWLVGQAAGRSDICAKALGQRFWNGGKAKAPAKPAKPAKQARQFLVIGHPRSGTTYMAKLMQAHGLGVGHETMRPDGISSWMMAADTDEKAPFGDGSRLRDYAFETVIHVVRDPIKVLASSIHTENVESLRYGLASWDYRVRHAGACGGNAYEQAVQMLLKWHDLARHRSPHWTIRVEDAPDRLKEIPGVGDPVKPLPPTHVRRRKHPPLTWNELRENVRDRDLLMRLAEYARAHGYDAPDDLRPLPADCPEHADVAGCLHAMDTARHRDAPPDLSEVRCLFRRVKLAITRLRKRGRQDTQPAWHQLRSDVEGHLETLCRNVNSRWLVSLLDTYADYGSDDERRNALLMVEMITWDRLHAATVPRSKMWDGLTVMGTSVKADAHRNLFRRWGRMMASTPPVSHIATTLLDRAWQHPQFLLNRLNEVSRRDIKADVNQQLKRTQARSTEQALRSVPRLSHFVWLGGDMPDHARECIEAFQRLHPTWMVRVWHEPPADMDKPLRVVFDRCRMVVQKSDILRAWVMREHGGVYFDTDFLYFRPIDELLNRAPWVMTNHNHPCNCAMAAAPHDPFFVSYCDRIARTGVQGRRIAYGPAMLKTMLREGCKANVLPKHYFTPVRYAIPRLRMLHADEQEQNFIIKAATVSRSDKVEPFGLHVGVGSNSAIKPVAHRGRAILARTRRDRSVQGTEVGVLQGALSAFLMEHHPDLRLNMVDRWDVPPEGSSYARSGGNNAGLTRERHEQNMAAAAKKTEPYEVRRVLIHKPSVEAAREIEDQSQDFVFIDADHSYEGCRDDIAAWLPKVRAGGILGGHDYNNLKWPQWGVKRAADELAEAMGVTVQLDANFTWFVTVPSSTAKGRVGRP